MKNYELKIYYKNKNMLSVLEEVYVTTIFFEKVTCKITKKDEKHIFEYIKFYKGEKEIASFFPQDNVRYEVICDE